MISFLQVTYLSVLNEMMLYLCSQWASDTISIGFYDLNNYANDHGRSKGEWIVCVNVYWHKLIFFKLLD